MPNLQKRLAATLTTALVLGVSPLAADDPAHAEPGFTQDAFSESATLRGNVVRTETQGPGHEAVVTVSQNRAGSFSVHVAGMVNGEAIDSTLDVEHFTLLNSTGEEFAADLRDVNTGQELTVDSTQATVQAVPAIVVLALLARVGLKWALKKFTRTQVKKAAKSYLLNQVSAQKWTHIMAPKHKWGEVGAKSKEQVAELMARAMSQGSHSNYGAAKIASWQYNGRTIQVTYSNGGQISNGWVK